MAARSVVSAAPASGGTLAAVLDRVAAAVAAAVPGLDVAGARLLVTEAASRRGRCGSSTGTWPPFPVRLRPRSSDAPEVVIALLPAPPRPPGAKGRPRKHGGELALADAGTWPAPQVTTSTVTSRYGTAAAAAWERVHPRLTHRAASLDHDGDLPVIEGTLIRLQVDHLPGDRNPKPLWLWHSRAGAAPGEVDRAWQAFLRRFDLEHTFRLFKQVLGLDRPEDPRPRSATRLEEPPPRTPAPTSAKRPKEDSPSKRVRASRLNDKLREGSGF